LPFTSTRVIPIPTFLWEYIATLVGNGANAVVLYTIIQMTKQYINDMELCDDDASELQVLKTPMLQVIWFACKHATNRRIMSAIGFHKEEEMQLYDSPLYPNLSDNIENAML
jgi:hypothetical protein